MKKPIKSRTINFAVLYGVFSAIQATLPSLQISSELYGYINMGVAIIIVLLRYDTDQPIQR